MGSNLCAPFFYNSILPDLSFSASSYDSKLQWEIAVGDSKKSIVSALTLDEDLRQLSGRPMNQKSFFVDPDNPVSHSSLPSYLV